MNRVLTLIVLCLIFASFSIAATLQGQGVCLTTTTEGPLAIRAVHLGADQPALFMADPQPTWALVLVRGVASPVTITPLSAKLSGKATVAGGKLTMQWEPYSAPGGLITVSCTFEADPRQPLLYGRIKVDNRSSYALKEVQFPCLNLAPTPSPADQITIVFPRAYGRSWRDPFHAPEGFLVGTQEPYGHWQPEMQFGTLYDDAGNGLYWAAYDGEILPKRFVIDNPTGAATLAVKIGQVGVGSNKAGADYASPYPVVLGAYRGDWWDAAHLYRTWALQQKWCRRGPLEQRADIPQIVKETDVWMRGNGRYGAGLHLMYARQIKEVLGGSVGIQMYDWTENDNWSDPLRWPPRNWFIPEVKQMSAENILVTPYINSKQWDTKAPSWPRGLEKWARTDYSGAAIVDTATGAQEPLAICAASKVFRDALVKGSARLVAEAGVAGIYLDQLGDQCGQPCYSPDHGHPVGAGSFGADGVREFCQAIRDETRKTNPQAFISGETPPESVLDVIDLRLNHYNIWPGWVNLWAAVYGDQVPSYGRSIFWAGVLGEGDNFYARCGNTLVSGVQFARLWPTGNPKNMLNAPEQAEVRRYFQDAVGLRRAARKFLTYGWLQRPVRFTNAVPELTVLDGKQRPMQISSVLATAWAAHDGTLGFVFTNISTQPQEVKWQADLSRHEIKPANAYALTLIRPDGKREPAGEVKGKLLERTETMPPHSTFALEVGVKE